MQIQCHIVLYLPDYHVNTHRVCSTVYGLAKWGHLKYVSLDYAQKPNRITNVEFRLLPPFCQTDVQATPPVSDIQQSTLITFFIYYLTVKI